MSQVKLGDKNIPFIYQGNNLLYPNPVKDGLVLWYDFKGMKNSDVSKNIARDLSGNGNDGELKNFVYTSESGYNNGLKFDGVDDFIGFEAKSGYLYKAEDDNKKHTISFCLKVKEDRRNNIAYSAEDLKIDAYGSSVHRTDNPFKINVSYPMLNNIVHVDMIYDGVNHYTFLDGILKDTQNIEISEQNINYTGISNVGTYIQSARANMEFYFIKIYNRALTDQEIQHNYQLEKERWGL